MRLSGTINDLDLPVVKMGHVSVLEEMSMVTRGKAVLDEQGSKDSRDLPTEIFPLHKLWTLRPVCWKETTLQSSEHMLSEHWCKAEGGQVSEGTESRLLV